MGRPSHHFYRLSSSRCPGRAHKAMTIKLNGACRGGGIQELMRFAAVKGELVGFMEGKRGEAVG